MSGTYDKLITLAWEGWEPSADVAQAVMDDIRVSVRGLSKPENLIFHIVQLTDDDEGPSVTVFGRPSSDAFHCTYSPVTKWVDVGGKERLQEPTP